MNWVTALFLGVSIGLLIAWLTRKPIRHYDVDVKNKKGNITVDDINTNIAEKKKRRFKFRKNK